MFSVKAQEFNSSQFPFTTEVNANTVKLMAVGDNLIHNPVIRSGKKGNTYNYEYMYKPMLETINKYDIRIINQETILVKNPKQYSSFPLFGSPYAIGEALAKSGFNVIASATNHSLDKGDSGVLETIEFWKNYPDITILGIYESLEDYEKIAIREIKGIKIAFLNYTYGVNGIALTRKKPYLVKLLSNKEAIVNEIQKAKELADFVIVLPHWGTEYVHYATQYQKNWAKIFADSGADLIIGTHPHVIEPLENIIANDGRIVPCYYSLGNFISAQIYVPRNLGGMADVEIVKDNQGTRIISAQMKATVTHRDASNGKFYAYPLEDYSNTLAKKHWLSRRGKFTKEGLVNLFNKVSR